MKNQIPSILAIFTLCFLCWAAGKKMAEPKVCFQLDGNELYAGLDNPISIVAQQDGPVRLDQVSVSGETYIYDESKSNSFDVSITEAYGRFIVRADSVGWVKFSVETPSGTAEKSFPVKPIPAVPYFGRSKNGKMETGMFRAQLGMIAYIECCDFDAKCNVLGYSIFRITTDNRVQRAMNQGGRLTDISSQIITAAAPGDIYWFRNIRYRCPGSKEAQLADNFSVEIE